MLKLKVKNAKHAMRARRGWLVGVLVLMVLLPVTLKIMMPQRQLLVQVQAQALVHGSWKGRSCHLTKPKRTC